MTEKLSLVSGSLPPGVEPPFLAPVSSIMGEVLFVGLESDRHSAIELRTTAETVIRRRLLAVPASRRSSRPAESRSNTKSSSSRRGCASTASRSSMSSRHWSAANRNATAGFQVAEGQEYLIRGLGRFTNVADIGAVVVRSSAQTPVLVRDLAEVREGAAVKRGDGSHNARPAVIIGIQKQPGANTLELTERIDTTLAEIQQALPEGMTIQQNLFRSADFIEQALDNLFKALLEGAGLVILVVIVFLMNARAAAITLVALPLSLIAAAVAMNWFGFTLNTMSLGGLAIAIGELVDDAIIDVENVVRRLRLNAALPAAERRNTLSVVYHASTEVRASVVFATVIVAIVFVPLFLLGSVEGRLLRPLGFAYVVALVASLVVALTVTPVLCSLLLPQSRMIASGAEPRLTRRLKELYEPWLHRAVRSWRLVIAGAAVALIAALVALFSTGRSFLPEFNEGALTVSAVTIPGTSLQDSNSLGNALERLLLSVPEVASTARRTGRAELDEHVQGVESAEIDVRLEMKDRSEGRRAARDQREGVAATGDERDGWPTDLPPHRSHAVGYPGEHRGQDFRRRSGGVARARDSRCRRRWPACDGVVDLSTEMQTEIPTLRVKVDPERASRHGLASGAVAQTLQTARVGRPVGQVIEGQIAVPAGRPLLEPGVERS